MTDSTPPEQALIELPTLVNLGEVYRESIENLESVVRFDTRMFGAYALTTEVVRDKIVVKKVQFASEFTQRDIDPTRYIVSRRTQLEQLYPHYASTIVVYPIGTDEAGGMLSDLRRWIDQSRR